MKRPMLFAFAALAFAAGAAQAQPIGGNPPTTTIVCLDVDGSSLPAVCDVPASRLDKSEYFCSCPRGLRTTAPVCPPGVDQPPESRALNRARKSASLTGSLVGTTFKGKPICVAPRNP
jgi:hypothetical protein